MHGCSGTKRRALQATDEERVITLSGKMAHIRLYKDAPVIVVNDPTSGTKANHYDKS